MSKIPESERNPAAATGITMTLGALLGVLLVAIVVVSLRGSGGPPPATPPAGELPNSGDGKAPDAPPTGKMVRVKIETSMGDIVAELNPDKAPVTVGNFLKYADDKHFDGTVFHRVIKNFMIQGGGFDAELVEKPTRAPIKNESANGLRNLRGTLAMARTPDPHSASAQWFISLKDNGFLDRESADDGWGYTVFGKVVEGMDVVDKIGRVETGSQRATVGGRMDDVPVTPVTIRAVRKL